MARIVKTFQETNSELRRLESLVNQLMAELKQARAAIAEVGRQASNVSQQSTVSSLAVAQIAQGDINSHLRSSDDHPQYALLAGRAGGQILIGGTGSGDDLTLNSTSHATKGDVLIQTGGGNVGIGTAAPGATLSLTGAATFMLSSGSMPASTANFFNNFNNYTGLLVKKSSTGTGTYLDIQNSSGVSQFQIDTSGNVGIGTSGIDSHLHLCVADATPVVRLERNDASIGTDDIVARIEVEGQDTDAPGICVKLEAIAEGNLGETGWRFSTGIAGAPAEVMRLTYLGYLGLGTTEPDQQFHIENLTGAIQRMTRADTAADPDDIIGRIEFETRDTGAAGVAAYIQALAEGTGGEVGLALATGTGGAAVERIRIANTGLVTVAGAGYVTSGLYVGANSTNNLIDDASNGAGSTALYIGNKVIATTSDIAALAGVYVDIAGDTMTGTLNLDDDNISVIWGEGQDAGISYNGTNLLINPKLVGTGYVNIQGQTLVDDKIMFTQTDGNEYIDSLADGYLDLGATTEVRLNGPATRVTGDLYVGNNAAVDPAIVFDGDSNDGQITYMEDEDYFIFSARLNITGIPAYANNAAAIGGGLVAGDLYRTNGDPDLLCIVH